MMPGPLDGLATLAQLRESDADLPVIMMSGRAGLSDAVRATKLGAFNFLEKPLSPESVLLAIAAALRAPPGARSRPDAARGARHSVARSSARAIPMRRVARAHGPRGSQRLPRADHRRVRAPAKSSSPPPFMRGARGETDRSCASTARRFRATSSRARCSGTSAARSPAPPTAASAGSSSRTHGHAVPRRSRRPGARGAGQAAARHRGKGNRARRRRRDRSARTCGSSPPPTRTSRARLPKATFREDLYFRIAVIPIALPPLRDRSTDIPALVQHFTALHRGRTGRAVRGWSDDALRVLTTYRWPGNVRELANIVERIAILHAGDLVSEDDVLAVLPVDATAEPVWWRGDAHRLPHGRPRATRVAASPLTKARTPTRLPRRPTRRTMERVSRLRNRRMPTSPSLPRSTPMSDS